MILSFSLKGIFIEYSATLFITLVHHVTVLSLSLTRLVPERFCHKTFSVAILKLKSRSITFTLGITYSHLFFYWFPCQHLFFTVNLMKIWRAVSDGKWINMNCLMSQSWTQERNFSRHKQHKSDNSQDCPFREAKGAHLLVSCGIMERWDGVLAIPAITSTQSSLLPHIYLVYLGWCSELIQFIEFSS